MPFLRMGMCLIAILVAAACASAPNRFQAEASSGKAPAKLRTLKTSREVSLNDASGRLSYRRVLERAQNANASILAARDAWAASRQVRAQATEYPDPVFRFGYFAEEVRTRTGDQVLSIGVSQMIPWPGKLESKGRVADIKAIRAELKALIATRDVLVKVAGTYVEYGYLAEAIEISSTITDAWKRVLAAAQKDPSQRRVAETLRAETELAQSQYDLQTWRELAEVERAKLRAHLSLPRSSPLGVPAKTTVVSALAPLDELQQAAQEHNQDLALAQVTLRLQREKITLAEQSDRPSFSVSGRYIPTRERRDADPRYNGNDPIFVELGVTIPLGRKARRAEVKEADLRARSASHARDAIRYQIDADIAGWYWKVINAQRVVRLYQDSLLPQVRRAARAAEDLAQTGTSGLAGLLETVANWSHLELAAGRAEADLRLAMLQLERRVGTPMASFASRGDPKTGAKK
ncbi:MAG: TolC family protein [Planctomycetota bacterium]